MNFDELNRQDSAGEAGNLLHGAQCLFEFGKSLLHLSPNICPSCLVSYQILHLSWPAPAVQCCIWQWKTELGLRTVLRLCCKNRQFCNYYIREYVGQGGNAGRSLSYQNICPSLNGPVNGQYNRMFKSWSFFFQESGYEPSRSLHPHALGSHCCLKLGWNILSKFDRCNNQSVPVNRLCFTIFAPLKCSSFLLLLFLSLNNGVSVYASLFQIDRETEKESEHFTLCTQLL